MSSGTPHGYALWFFIAAAIIIVGLFIAYGSMRAGRLRRSERDRLDRNTEGVRHVEEAAEENASRPDFGLRKDVPYGIIIPIIAVCFAIMLMFWSFYGTNTGAQQASTTTGSAPARQTQQPVQAPVAPNNPAASDSARGGQQPLNKDQ